MSTNEQQQWAANQLLDYERRKQEFLQDWQDVIGAVEAYSTVILNRADSVTIAPEHVIERLGPELTAMARATRRLERLARGTARRLRDEPDHPDRVHGSSQAWGARQALAVGLGVHCGLNLEHAEWLAEGVSGFEVEHLDRVQQWKAELDRKPPPP